MLPTRAVLGFERVGIVGPSVGNRLLGSLDFVLLLTNKKVTVCGLGLQGGDLASGSALQSHLRRTDTDNSAHCTHSLLRNTHKSLAS